MKRKNIFVIPFRGKSDNRLDHGVVLVSLAVAAAAGYYFIKEYLAKKDAKNAEEKNVIDKRMKSRQSSEDLLGDLKHRHDPSKINVPEAGTLNWKKNTEKSMFPPVPDPNIRIT